MYPIAFLSAPHNFIAAMMCRLFGKANSTKFSIEWIPLIDAVVNAMSMNQSQILSDNLVIANGEYRKKKSVSSRIFPPFYMSIYVVDVIRFFPQFPNMGWKWTVKNPLPIHVYYKILSKSQFNSHFYKIYQGIMLPIYKATFYKTTPRLSKEAKIDILQVTRWFAEETFTYIRVFGNIAAPHVLP